MNNRLLGLIMCHSISELKNTHSKLKNMYLFHACSMTYH